MDWKNPDYTAIYIERAKKLEWIRANPDQLPALKAHYKENIADFISDWGMTFDPRNAERGLPTVIPFVLFDKQREWIDWVIQHWKDQEDGLTEKSRDCGLSWLSVGLGVGLWSFYDGVVVGFSSRKEEYVDKLGSPKSLFWKARKFIEMLPVEFQPDGWEESKHALFMRILNPETGSAMVGEAGDNIGRGDRQSIALKDESAFFERPENIDAALSQTTNCQMDISTVNGDGNVFAKKRHSGKVDVFTFHWKSDPRKDQAWYDKQVDKYDPVIVAQEIDIDYSASKDNVLIKSEWVRAAVCFDLKRDGPITAGYDPSDGGDKAGVVVRHGPIITNTKEWTPKNVRVGTGEAFYFACENDVQGVNFDSIGVGSNAEQDIPAETSMKWCSVAVSASPLPGMFDDKRTNQAAFENLRANLGWDLRQRFKATFEHKHGLKVHNPEDMISIPDDIELIRQCSLLSWGLSKKGKIKLQDKAELADSPALFDALMLAFKPIDLYTQPESYDIPNSVSNWR